MDDIDACLNDADGDGYATTSDGGSDCNDNNLFINPQVTDFGDGIDRVVMASTVLMQMVMEMPR